MKKLLLVFAIAFALVSCGGDDKVPGVLTTEFTGSGFALHLPENWSSSGTIATPSANGEVVLSAVSPEKKYNFSDNILVLRDNLDGIISSKQYAVKNNLQTKQKYLEYTLSNEWVIYFPDSDESRYYVFRAKYNNQIQKLQFIQTAKVCGTTVYLLNATTALDTDAEEFVNIFRTFECK